jgi:molecular chaperone GrpE (heat shock protein)
VEVSWAFTLFLLGVLLVLNLFTEYRLKELLMALADDLQAIKDQLDKASAEITGKIDALEAALASAGEQPEAVTEAVASLKLVAQSLDDVVPDTVIEEPPVV